MSTVKICEHDVAEQECPYCKHKTHYDLVIELQATIEQQAAKIAELEASEKEGWRYADELEQERKRLEAIIKEQP